MAFSVSNRITAAFGSIALFPAQSVIRGYRAGFLGSDFKAAVNVSLLAFPQGMAYALIAGVPLSYGIFGSAVAAIAGALFTRSPFIMLGPTNATAVLIMSGFLGLGLADQKLILLPLVILLAGIFLILVAIFHLSTFLRYVSRTVITGYITAAALLIIANQLKGVLGITFHNEEKGNSFFWLLYYTGSHITELHWSTVGLSIFTVGLYFLIRTYSKVLPAVALALVGASGAAWLLRTFSSVEFSYLTALRMNAFQPGIPALGLDEVSMVLGLAVAIGFLCLLEGVSIGSSLAARLGQRLDTRQEIFNMGMANIACSVFSGMPASGSLTRSVLSVSSGARTPLSSLMTGLLLAGGAVVLGPLVAGIPTASLAALIVVIGISLIKPDTIRIIVRATVSDRAIFWVTVATGLLLGLDNAIYVGTFLSVVLFLQKASRPELVEFALTDADKLVARPEVRKRSEVSIVHVEGDLFFGAADLFRDQIRRLCDDPNLRIIILRMRNARLLDATSVLAMMELSDYMREHERFLIVTGVQPEVYSVLRNSGIVDHIGRDNVIAESPDNPTLSTAQAIRRAREVLGGEHASVSLYTQPKAINR